MKVEEIDQLISQLDAVQTEDTKVCELAARISLTLGLLAGRLEELGCDRLTVNLKNLLPAEVEEVAERGNPFAFLGPAFHEEFARLQREFEGGPVSKSSASGKPSDSKKLPGLGEK